MADASLLEVAYCLAMTNMADASQVEVAYCLALTNMVDASQMKVAYFRSFVELHSPSVCSIKGTLASTLLNDKMTNGTTPVSWPYV